MLSNAGTIISKVLEFATDDYYVHVSISFDKDLKNIYSFGRKYIRFPLPGGLVKENLELTSKYFKTYSCKIYEMELTYQQYKKLKNDLHHNYLANEKKYKYNIIGLPLIKLNFEYKRDYHLTCSQFCSKLLIENQVAKFNKSYTIIRPHDFQLLDNVKEIFEGRIIDYLKIKKTN